MINISKLLPDPLYYDPHPKACFVIMQLSVSQGRCIRAEMSHKYVLRLKSPS